MKATVEVTPAVETVRVILNEFEELQALKSIGIKALQGMDFDELKARWIRRMDMLTTPDSLAWLETYGLLAHGVQDMEDLLQAAYSAPNGLLLGLTFGHIDGWQLGSPSENKRIRRRLLDESVEQYCEDSAEFALGVQTGWLFAKTRYAAAVLLRAKQAKDIALTCCARWKASAAQVQKTA